MARIFGAVFPSVSRWILTDADLISSKPTKPTLGLSCCCDVSNRNNPIQVENLPTFTIKSQVNVGKYTIHELYGNKYQPL